MALIIDKNLLAVDKLISYGIEIKERINSYNLKTIRILIVNLMPKKWETEFQFLRILGTMDINLQVDFLQMETYMPKNIDKNYLREHYKSLRDIEESSYEGMIITGAPLEFLNFEDVKYWDELKQVIDYSKKKVKSTIYLCWSAMAGLSYNYDINKCMVKKKVFGAFSHRIINENSPLLIGLSDGFIVPHSRYLEIRKSAIARIEELEILSESEEAGIYIVSTRDGKEIYITGHPEYEKYTLRDEYERDIRGEIDVNLPKNYFIDDDYNIETDLEWEICSQNLFKNWINEILGNS